MEWDAFISEYRQFFARPTRAGQAEEAVAVERLRDLAETVDGAMERSQARDYVTNLEYRNDPVRRVGDGLWERLHDAVGAETGAESSLWQYGKVESGPDLRSRATADPDGRVFLSQQVIKPLQDLYDSRGLPSTEQERIERRTALQDAARAFVDLTGPEEHQVSDRLHDLDRQYVPIGFGTAAAWSHGRLDQLADKVLPADLAAEVKSVRSPQPIPDFAPAAEKFAERVGAEIGIETHDLLARMTREPRPRQAGVAAELLFERSGLSELVTTGRGAGAEARWEIETVINQGFADLKPLPKGTDSDTRREVSGQRGVAIAESAVAKVGELGERYRSAQAPTAQQRATVEQGPGAQRQWSPQQAPAAQQQGAGQEAKAGDLESLREVLAPGAPAAGAPRLKAGEAAQGRQGGGQAAGRGAEAPDRGTNPDVPSR
ncbi:hypothetical protein [Kribbella sp. DT2]|uniref:hypothetical protein n=1 Tax=Kribbella sp. DT2 TaxID=3393427 RepID=UPI003CEF615F